MQVLITCRTEYLEAKGFDLGLFTPGEPSVATSQLRQLFVRSFVTNDIRAYFGKWVDSRASREDEEDSRDWNAEKYMDAIKSTPGLQELAETPFVLRALATTLPRLHSTAAPLRVTRGRIYAAFIDRCWEMGARRLRRVKVAGLPDDFVMPLSFSNYCTDLSLTMLAHNQVCLRMAAV